jgi:hypothetical protein
LGRRSSTVQTSIAENVGIPMAYANKLKNVQNSHSPSMNLENKKKKLSKHHPDLTAEWIGGKKLLDMMRLN